MYLWSKNDHYFDEELNWLSSHHKEGDQEEVMEQKSNNATERHWNFSPLGSEEERKVEPHEREAQIQ